MRRETTRHEMPARGRDVPGRTGEDLLARAVASAPRAQRSAAPARGTRSRPMRPGEPGIVVGKVYSPLAARFARLRRPGAMDYVLLLAVVVLLLLGLVMVYSASQFAIPSDPDYWFRHQVIWVLIGIAALTVTSRIEYQVWRKVALAGMGLCVALLIAVLIAGHIAYGAQRWLSLGLFSFQPSELTKLALVIYIADWLVRKGDAVRSLRNGLLPFAVLTGIVLGLILLQNDLGTSIVVALVALVMFYAAGANVLQLVPTLALGILAALVLAAGTSFRRARLDAFLQPLPPGCASASSYQVCQGLISLGSGGIFGRGLGDSVQKAGYLPNPFTDSIFAITGEELGLLGCALIVLLFGLLAFEGLRIGRRVPNAYGSLLACGITCWLVVQAAVNIGSVVDAIPFTGVPLPFVSYGGSSLATSLAAVGILLNISRHTGEKDKLPQRTPG